MAADILVTGATGHLGNVLIRKLTSQRKKVRALIYPGEDTTSLNEFDIERIEGDVLKPGCVRDAIEGVRYVYHLASLISIGNVSDELVRSVNIQGTRNIALACREGNVKRLVYVSSVHALQRPPDGMIIDETLSFDPNNPAGEYDRSKAEASLEVKRIAATGLDAVIVCPTGIIGPEDYRRSEMGKMICHWMKKRPHWMVEGSFDFVDVRDVADGLIAACNRGAAGGTYLLSGTRIRLSRLRELVQEEAGVHSAQIHVPQKIALAACKLTYPIQKLLGTANGFSPYAIETVMSNSHISSAKAKSQLKFRPRPIEESVKDTVAWWRGHSALDRYPGWYGKVALIAGATGGIGAAVARKLASKGLEVILVGRRTDKLLALKDEIISNGGRAQCIAADLTKEKALEKIHELVSTRYHGVDLLVYSAGIGWYGYFSDMSWETADTMLQVNVGGLTRLTLYSLKQMMLRKKGRVVLIGSIAGEIEPQGTAVYAATKSFVNTLSRSISRELRGSKIKASVLRPGAVASGFFETAKSLGRPIPAAKMGITPERVAEKVWSLLVRPRATAYVPPGLGILRFVRAGLGFVLDLLGPVHLKRQAPAGQ